MSYPGTLPSSADLRPHIDNVSDQGQLGSCTANASPIAMQVQIERAGGGWTPLSRLYLYYYERAVANTLGQEGAMPSNMVATLQTKGICLEASWPYDPANENVQPPASLDAEAAQHTVVNVESPPWMGAATYAWIKDQVASGRPVLLSFNVTQDFMSHAGDATDWRKTFWQPEPNSPFGGSHEVCIIGYDDNCPDGLPRLLVQNSWGPGWGDGGFFGFPVAFLSEGTTQYAFTVKGTTPIPVPGLTPAQVQQAYVDMLGCAVADFNFPGYQYWIKQPGATERDMYYAGELRMAGLLDGSIKP